MDSLGQIIVGVMGGGLVLLIPVVVKAAKDLKRGQLAKEDTAISRWKDYSIEKQKEATFAWEMVTAFRKWYYRLWAQYVRVTGDEDTFPSDPVTYEKELRKEEKDDQRKRKPDEAE